MAATGSICGYNGTVLVRLRAVAMERDDNSDGWVPMGAGGLSNVCVVKRTIPTPPLPDAPAATATSSLPGAPAGGGCQDANGNSNNLNIRFEFVIYAHRLIDGELVFRCVICKDFEYNKVMPTFHNWKSGGKRVGLIFQTAADGRVFDRGIMGVLVELSAGIDLLPTSFPSVESDNEVFMAVELPYKFDNKRNKPENNNNNSNSNNNGGSRHVSPTSTDSSSQKGGGGGTPTISDTSSEMKTYRFKQLSPNEQNYLYQPAPPPPLPPSHHQHQRTLLDSGNLLSTTTATSQRTRSSAPGCGSGSAACYTPSSTHHQHQTAESPVMFKKHMSEHTGSELHFTMKAEKPQSLTCRHCRKTYTEEENVKGSCEYAPDCVRTSIDTVTCIPCARTMVYHCMSDSEGNFAQQPCECDTSDSGCAKRWLGLAILSIILPCLWCYPPLKLCHLCGVSCGACGGRHEPLNTPSAATT
ncbi:sprouty-related, EVH1 domain-containing protein 2-like isoform X2 [Planococcus citri]|uniref:sprouty-related, EVH1 domain-containing protein 2-like isoform X2 n=1 Tax=Planococcus citri TaxID=170843 RepID=UPI0031F8C400